MTLAVRVFLTFLAAYVLSQFYRSFLAVIAPELARELALDPQALGNLQAFWILGFVATQFPGGLGARHARAAPHRVAADAGGGRRRAAVRHGAQRARHSTSPCC